MPTSLDVDLIARLADADLTDVLFPYVCVWLGQAGCYGDNGPGERDVLQKMPPGLVATWSLMVMEGEVLNGGFYQWLTNPGGETADLALRSLQLIGAEKHAELVREVFAVDQRMAAAYPRYAKRFEPSSPQPGHEGHWGFGDDFDQVYFPELSRLDTAYYELQEQDDFWRYFERYVRRNPSDCVHTRQQ